MIFLFGSRIRGSSRIRSSPFSKKAFGALYPPVANEAECQLLPSAVAWAAWVAWSGDLRDPMATREIGAYTELIACNAPRQAQPVSALN